MKPTTMTTTPTRSLLIAALGCAVAGLGPRVAAQDKPSFEIAPYLWLANPSIETSLPHLGSGGSSGAQKFDTRFSGGLLLAAEARYRSVGLLVDFNWLQLDTDSINSGPLGTTVGMKSDYIYSTAALTYTLPLKGKFHAEGLAGARVWYVGADFTTGGGPLRGFGFSESQSWVSPVIGANLSYDLTRHWQVLVRGKLGGVSDGDFGWELFGGVGYRFTDWLSAMAGYRYLYQQYNHSDFSFKADVQGALLGVAFKF
jgi:outer membrane receptor protein involved in Fe transport